VSSGTSDIEKKGSAPKQCQKACKLQQKRLIQVCIYIYHFNLARPSSRKRKSRKQYWALHLEEMNVAQSRGWAEIKDIDIIYSGAMPNENINCPEPDAEDRYGTKSVYRQHLIPSFRTIHALNVALS